MKDTVGALLVEARKHGLSLDREPAFLLWVGNEVFEGREGQEFKVLAARAQALVLMFKNQDRQSAER